MIVSKRMIDSKLEYSKVDYPSDVPRTLEHSEFTFVSGISSHDQRRPQNPSQTHSSPQTTKRPHRPAAQERGDQRCREAGLRSALHGRSDPTDPEPEESLWFFRLNALPEVNPAGIVSSLSRILFSTGQTVATGIPQLNIPVPS